MQEGPQHMVLRQAMKRRHALISRVFRQTFDIKIEGLPGPYPGDPDASRPKPRLGQADGVAVFVDDRGKARTAVIIEIQRGREPQKAAVWLNYLAEAALEFDCEIWLLVVAPSKAIGNWTRNLKGGKYFKIYDLPIKVIDASNVRIPDVDGELDDAILATWVRSAGEPDWKNAAEVAIKLLKTKEDLELLSAGIDDERLITELKKMVKAARRPFVDELIEEERAEAAKIADSLATAREQAKAARKHVNVLKLLAQTHPDITPTLEAAEQEALAAEAKLAELNSNDE